MFCTSCGIKNAADSNFCRQCGSKLEKAAAPKISEDDFDRALPADEQMSALLERAYRLRKEGNLDGAIALCEEALRLRPDSASSHSLLGQLYEEKGDRAAAIGAYERVLELNPGSIADRVTLDQLRAHETANGGEGKTRPRVRMGDHRTLPAPGYSRFTNAGVAIALLALGGILANQFRPRTASPAPNVSSGFNAVVHTDKGDEVVENVKISPSASSPAPSQAAQPPVDTAATKPQASPASAPQIAAVPSTAVPAAPNVIYRPAPPQIRYIRETPPDTMNGANGVASVRLPGKRTRAGSKDANTSFDNSNRVVLNDPDVVEGNGGKITVKVNGSDVPDKSGDRSGDRTDRTSARSGDNSNDTPAPGAILHVEAAKPSNGGRSGAASASGDARSFIAVGEEKKRQRDFKGAIEAFTRALGSAGDQAGYVLQQRALCYQNLTDSASAKADYTHAIDEYRKLEARDPETARLGIRTCQSGIRICGN